MFKNDQRVVKLLFRYRYSCYDSCTFRKPITLPPSLPPPPLTHPHTLGKLCYLVLRQQYHTVQPVVAVADTVSKQMVQYTSE